MSAPNAAREPDELSGKTLLLDAVVFAALVALAYWLVRAGAPQLGAPIIALTPTIIELVNKVVRGKAWAFRRFLIAITLGLAYFAGYLTPTVLTWITTPTVTLSFDHTGPVGRYETITVQWRDFRDGDAPGLFIYAINSGLYYPQSCGMTAAPTGTQSCKIEIGSDTEDGEAFEAVTAALNEGARQELAKYSKDPISAGLPLLPQGAKRISAIKIVRRTQ